MKLKKVTQPTLAQAFEADFDAFITCSGYEERSRFVAEQATETLRSCAAKEAWGFAEHRDAESRLQNDEFYRSQGYKLPVIPGSDCSQASNRAAAAICGGSGTERRVLVDISSMTRAWSGSIVNALSSARSSPITVVFAYSPADFTPFPTEILPNKLFGPVPGFLSCIMPNRATALVLGLGHESGRALGIVDSLDPGLTILFYAKPAASKEYELSVRQANPYLMKTVPEQNIFGYSIMETAATFKILESICAGLRREWRPVLSSTGPKIFALYGFLLATLMPELTVWRATPAETQPPVDRKACGSTVLLETTWE